MNKTTEALELADVIISRYRNETPIGNQPHMICHIADEALAAIREARAEQEKQEPVAHYKDAPHTIYLQTGCDDPEDCECSFNEWGDTTWCADQIHDTDIPYIRADYAAPVSSKREWVDLTDREAEAAFDRGGNELCLKLRAVIAAFKEKNK